MEHCNNVKPYMQPYPQRNVGGDCFACALTAGLQYLFPEEQVDFNKAWEYFLHENPDGKKHLDNTWRGMQNAIIHAAQDKFRVHGETHIVRPEFNLEITSHNWWRFFPTQEYVRVLEGFLRSSWVVFTNINFAGAGASTNGIKNSNDHFAIVDGVRTVWESIPAVEGAKTLRYYVHVVCSAKGTYWINADDWLEKHGAAGWILMRSER